MLIFICHFITLSATLEEEAANISYTIIFEFSNSGEQDIPDYYYYYESDRKNWELIYDGIVDDTQYYYKYPSSIPSTLYIGYADSNTAEGEAVTLLGNSGDADLDNATDVFVSVVLSNDSGSLTADITVTTNS